MRGAWRSALSKLLGFGFVPALSLASSVVLLPLVAHRFGPQGWSAISLGTAVGAYAGVLIGLSWPVTGPHRVARADNATRQAIYTESVRSRGLVFLLALVPVIVVSGLITFRSPYMLSTILVAVGISFNGFTGAWYFAGAGAPWLLVRNEAIVRCFYYVVIILLLVIGYPFWIYGVVLVLSGLTMFLANWLTVVGVKAKVSRGGSFERESIRDQLSGAIARFANSSFGTLTPVLYAAAQVPGLPTFTALDQVQKTANNGLSAFPQALIGFVSRHDGILLKKRLKLVVCAAIAATVCVIVLSHLLGPTVMELLYRGKANPDRRLIDLVGVTIAMAFLGQLLQQVVLVPTGMIRTSYVAMTSISLAGIPTLIIGAASMGVLGAVGAVTLVIGTIACIYLILAISGIRRITAPS